MLCLQKKQEVSNFREILVIQHCPNKSRKFKSNQFIYNICTHNSQCIPQTQGENTGLMHKNCENLSLFYFLPRQAKSIFLFVCLFLISNLKQKFSIKYLTFNSYQYRLRHTLKLKYRADFHCCSSQMHTATLH